ncbi:hypothetical protein K9M59_04165 [Candidatus Gracilibacteria bacterium]|nr:hypothetical protein [Candidatus Gracilibacteria bacterium]MCF7819515.1 hypothetical protein [Candidatus Gracilibacteria bacterium]
MENKEREAREVLREKSSLYDPEGKKLCDIEYSLLNGEICKIQPIPFSNTEKTAEKNEEIVFCTTEEGKNVHEEDVSRAEAREKGLRYLVVTTLLFHGKEMLLQKRSSEKKIDPGKYSASAHGVAKQLYFQNGSKVRNEDNTALVNTALEINEELRHGEETPSFSIDVWQGTVHELNRWAEANQINDPDTIYLVPTAFYNDDGYPLGDRTQKRTRALSMGFIFSKEKPSLSIDPSELSSVEWEKASEFSEDPGMTEDLQSCVDAAFAQLEEESIQKHSAEIAKKALRQIFSQE